MSLAMKLREHAATQPDRPAIIASSRTYTWAELDVEVDGAALALIALNLPGSAGHPARVAIKLGNEPEFVIALLGAMRAGLIAVPVNPTFTPREVDHVLSDSGAALLIDGDYELGRGTGRLLETEEIDPEQLAVLLYTSGTEGAPKGAMLPHRALLANHEQLGAIEPAIMRGSDVVLLALPMFHAYGLNSGLGAVLWYGATGVLAPDFHPARTAELIAAHRVTVVVGVPQMYLGWAALPGAADLLSSIRLGVCGAAALSTTDSARFTSATGLTVHIGYGLTETAPVLTSTLLSERVKPGSIGRPLPGVELKLDMEIDEDDDAEDVGEIVVRGRNLFLGYWPDKRGGPDADGWWGTRDVAYADDDGDLFIVDRLGELIIVSGFNVYPAEVEQVLVAHPAVLEAAALGIRDEVTGQAVKAVVVLAPGSTVGPKELAEHCARNLARFKCPAEYDFADALPHSVTGKVRKSMLREDGL